jgi:hypothetical protein
MFRFALILTCTAVITCAVAITGVIAGARVSTSAPSPVLHPGDCALPCWMDMHFSSTTLDQAQARLGTLTELTITQQEQDTICFQFGDDQPMDRGCVRSYPGISYPENTIALISLWTRRDSLRIGDLLVLYGKPSAVDNKCDAQRSANIHFAGNVFAVMPPDIKALNPFAPVEYMTLVSPIVIWSGMKPDPWRGFVRCS